ncbi:MAG: hypothetical protein IJU96_06270 [Clostridia bacterium]|nr:hypothetical protein [Clostridia bacterium]
MTFINDFVSAYGLTIVYAALTAIAGAVGVWAKRLIERYRDDKTKREVAEICVRAVEQVYRDLHGSEKFQKCAEAMAEMLAQRGVPVTELEIMVLCEAALAQFNGAFSRQSVVKCEDE